VCSCHISGRINDRAGQRFPPRERASSLLGTPGRHEARRQPGAAVSFGGARETGRLALPYVCWGVCRQAGIQKVPVHRLAIPHDRQFVAGLNSISACLCLPDRQPKGLPDIFTRSRWYTQEMLSAAMCRTGRLSFIPGASEPEHILFSAYALGAVEIASSDTASLTEDRTQTTLGVAYFLRLSIGAFSRCWVLGQI